MVECYVIFCLRFCSFLNKIQILHIITKNQHWVSGGEFNIISCLLDKNGGHQNMEVIWPESFKDLIQLLKSLDIDTINGMLTWNNRSGGDHQITSRLDWFLLSINIMTQSMLIEASILLCVGLDHLLVCLNINIVDHPSNKPFIFEKLLLNIPYFQNNIVTWWLEEATNKGSQIYLSTVTEKSKSQY